MGWDFRSRRGLALFFAVLTVSILATVVYQNSNFYGFERIADFASNLFTLGEEIPLQTSCLSRNQSFSYRKPSSHQMSAYLLSKIHAYEDRHRRCGPNTGPYNQTLRHLLESNYHVNANSSGSNPTTPCSYVIWSPKAGLGNRMMTLVSSFLYALLTNRVLLVDFALDMGELFCEPFLNTSWILPKNFPYREDGFRPIKHLQDVMKQQQNSSSTTTSFPSFLLVDVTNGVGDDIELFHCDDSQIVLGKVPIVVIRSDLYFAPLLFITPSFIPELNKMFPEKETVFHHLGQYLLQPSDTAWELITKYYHTYNLHKADVKVGLQIRVVNDDTVPPRVVMDQILRCTQKNGIFPMSSNKGKDSLSILNTTSKVVLVTSLFPDYAKGLRALYGAGPTSSGEVIEVYQASSDGYQKMGNRKQNMEAWAEMYLLSLCDMLVTTGESTFGYVAQGLGSLKPWVLRKQDKDTARLPACYRAVTIDACSHFRPHYDCKTKGYTDHITDIFPHVKACEDRLWWGLRLSDGH